MDGRGSPDVWAMALSGMEGLALDQGDLDRAQEACEEGLELLAQKARETSKASLPALTIWRWWCTPKVI